jgi:hypothetical protein
MALPANFGLSYYPVKRDKIDSRLSILVSFGTKGYFVVDYLIHQIHINKGYWLLWDSNNITSFINFCNVNNLGISKLFIKEVIKLAVKSGIFDGTIFNNYKILTSTEIQETYFFIVKDYKSKPLIDTRILLVEPTYFIENNMIGVFKFIPLLNSRFDYSSISFIQEKERTKEKEETKENYIKENYKKEKNELKYKEAHTLSEVSRVRTCQRNFEYRSDKCDGCWFIKTCTLPSKYDLSKKDISIINISLEVTDKEKASELTNKLMAHEKIEWDDYTLIETSLHNLHPENDYHVLLSKLEHHRAEISNEELNQIVNELNSYANE